MLKKRGVMKACGLLSLGCWDLKTIITRALLRGLQLQNVWLHSPILLISHLWAGRGELLGCGGNGGMMHEEEEEVSRRRKRKTADGVSTECLTVIASTSSQSSQCRVSVAALLHNGLFPCRRKARSAAELFSSVDARAGGKIGGDLPHKHKAYTSRWGINSCCPWRGHFSASSTTK